LAGFGWPQPEVSNDLFSYDNLYSIAKTTLAVTPSSSLKHPRTQNKALYV